MFWTSKELPLPRRAFSFQNLTWASRATLLKRELVWKSINRFGHVPSLAQGHIPLVRTEFSLLFMLLLIPPHSWDIPVKERAKIQVLAPRFMKEIMRENGESATWKRLSWRRVGVAAGGGGSPPKFLAISVLSWCSELESMCKHKAFLFYVIFGTGSLCVIPGWPPCSYPPASAFQVLWLSGTSGHSLMVSLF